MTLDLELSDLVKGYPGSNFSKVSEARIVVVTPNKVVQKKVFPPSSQC